MWRKLARLRLSLRILLLTSAVALAGLLAAPWAAMHRGTSGLSAALLAAALCWFGAAAALVVGDRFRRPDQAIVVLGISIVLRTALPLAVGTIVFLLSPWLAEAGWMYYLLVFYLVTLACETVLLVASLQGDRPTADDNRNRSKPAFE